MPGKKLSSSGEEGKIQVGTMSPMPGTADPKEHSQSGLSQMHSLWGPHLHMQSPYPQLPGALGGPFPVTHQMDIALRV